jgi:phage shock protein A
MSNSKSLEELNRKLKESDEKINQLQMSLEQSKSANKRIKKDTKYIDYNRLLDRFNRQKEKLERYENIIGSIANVDCAFVSPDGNEDCYTDKQAMELIDEIIKPVWEEMCKESNKAFFKGWGK